MAERVRRRFLTVVILAVGLLQFVADAPAQTPPIPPPAAPADPSTAELLKRMQQLESEVKEVRQLRDKVDQLQTELTTLRETRPTAIPPLPRTDLGNDPEFWSPAAPAPKPAPSKTGGIESDDFPLQVKYKYNFAGGYTQISDKSEEFTLKIQNQITADGTFYDRQNIPTSEKGFNIPFQRLYLYGNITKNWEYQLATEGFLGSFNLLDAFVNAHFDDRVQLKMGRMLSPFLYEYYAFSPAWEPLITNSPIFQLAGKRQVGAMVWGKLFNNKVQYQTGVYNGVNGGFYDLDRNKDFVGSLTFTPFKGNGNVVLDNLGLGASVETGNQSYLLNSGNSNNFANGAGEPTLNQNYITSTGVPFFQYENNVRAAGNRTKVAPHFFWFGRFSLLGEYVYQSRQLADGLTSARSVQQGFYVNASYFLTGERYNGDGLGGYTTISPLRPFDPYNHQYGPGAWEVAGQFSELNVGTSDFKYDFADPNLSASRLDQVMVGINWWPNKYVRTSFDWVNDKFNHAIPLNGGNPIDRYNIFWTRVAMFF